MKEKKPFYKKWWFWVLVALFFLVMGNANTGNKQVTPKEEPVEEVVEEVSEEVKELTTVDQLTAIVEDLSIEQSDLKVIQGVPDNDRFNISYTSTATVWDETDFVSSSLSDYVDICSKAYQIDGVNSIQLFVYVGMTDAKGNEKTEKGFDMCMPKDVFNTFNWENLKYQQGKYSFIKNECEFLDIHLGISSKVDFDKVMYK